MAFYGIVWRMGPDGPRVEAYRVPDVYGCRIHPDAAAWYAAGRGRLEESTVIRGRGCTVLDFIDASAIGIEASSARTVYVGGVGDDAYRVGVDPEWESDDDGATWVGPEGELWVRVVLP